MDEGSEKPKFTPSSPARLRLDEVQEGGSPPPVEGEKRKGKSLNRQELVYIAFELGFIIALPIVAFSYAGKWLDARMDSEPIFALVGILIAIASTSIWIYRKFKNYF